uniref:Uncharacterized protein n=1 Tax=Meloidogyne enterolobii TaxID=390850 RepID=A0A6V7VZD7_MELEN|nr:unnamed protein product [Meloidogyne enterolobii]
MSPFFSLFLFLLFCISNNETAKILFTFYHDRGSHFGSMLPLMEKLASNGHSVYVLDTIFSINKSKLINYHRAQLPQDDEGKKLKRLLLISFGLKQILLLLLMNFLNMETIKLEY